MTKISAKTVKKVGWTASGIWLVVFLSFMAFDIFIKPKIAQPWAESVATGFVFLVGGTCMFIASLIFSIAAWTMSPDEHPDMLMNMSFHGKAGASSFLSLMPKSYWLWQNRILSLLVIPLGLILAGVGIVTLIITYLTYT